MERRRFLRNVATAGAALAAPAVLRGRVALAEGGPEISTRAVDLVFGSPVVDMLGLLTMDWQRLYGWFRHPTSFAEDDFRRLERTGVSVFHPAVEIAGADPGAIARRWLAGWQALTAGTPCFLARVESAADLAAAAGSGRLAVVVGFQNSTHFTDAADVETFHRLGQRVSQLTYNDRNRLGDGSAVVPDRGLTPFGAAVVAEMNRVGMAVDVSHCGERTARDAIAASTRPVLVTHANCKRLAPAARRNRSDELIRALAAQGGVMGITVVRAFVGGRAPDLGTVLDHFDHVAELVGVEHVGIGSDVSHDAVDPATGRPKPPYAIRGLDLGQRVFQLADGLLGRGWSEADVALALGGNFLRALKEIWGEPAPGPTRFNRRDPFCPPPRGAGLAR